jgi:transposase
MRGNTFYDILFEQDPEVVNLPIKDLQKLLRRRSSVHFAMKVKIIELRFGRYGVLQPVRMSITNIAKKVSIARSTVYKIIQHYKINDGVISGIPEKHQRKKILTNEIAAVLKDPKILREWAHLSLEARCSILKEQYNVQMSRYTLSNYYKELQVGYLKTHSSFYSARSEEETARLRVEYIKKIVGHMRRKREIIYMDETTTDMWAIRNKIWQPKDSVLPLVI